MDDLSAALQELGHGSTDTGLLPERLTQACVAALPVDGAGLSYAVHPDRRLPLGASGPEAAAAERLQFALGEGPCITAQAERRVVRARSPQMATRWPVYAAHLADRTPYCSVLAMPLRGPLSAVVAVDLYSRQPDVPVVADDVLTELGDFLGAALAADMAGTTDHELGLPRWLHSPPIMLRQQVWLAIGHVSARQGVTNTTALALLRAHAFRHDIDLEETAERVLGGELPST